MRNWKRLGIVAGLIFLSSPSLSSQEKVTHETLVAQHLKSLGSSEQMRHIKSRSAAGVVEFSVTTNMETHLKGQAWLFAEGPKLRVAFPFGHPDYLGEHAVFDGVHAVIQSQLGGQRSSLGQFLTMFDGVLREGLLAGTLSSSWPLLDMGVHQPKLSYEGLKTLEGVSCHILTYQPRKAIGTMRIQLAFDRETFRHLRTIYRVKLPTPLMAELPAFAGGIRIIQESQETQVTAEEIFDGFEIRDGIALPTRWTIRISQEVVSAGTGFTVSTSRQPVSSGFGPDRPVVLEWRTTFAKVAHNETIPPQVFVLQP